MMPTLPAIGTLALTVLSGSMATAGPILAQDPLEFEEPVVSTGGEGWGLALSPYAWFAAQSSDVGGQKLRQSFNDLSSITNVGFQGRLTARFRGVILHGDWTYADQSSATRIGRTSVDLALKQHILDLKLGARVYDSRTPEQDGGFGLWVAAGARYWDSDVNFTITNEPLLPGGDTTVVAEKTGQSWWDPVLGVLAHWPVTPSVGFSARATVGGLGIGNASDYLWDAEAVATFRLGKRFLLAPGFRTFKYDRTDGEGEDEIRQTVTVVGPLIGLSIGLF
jgi:hypothetical protein